MFFLEGDPPTLPYVAFVDDLNSANLIFFLQNFSVRNRQLVYTHVLCQVSIDFYKNPCHSKEFFQILWKSLCCALVTFPSHFKKNNVLLLTNSEILTLQNQHHKTTFVVKISVKKITITGCYLLKSIFAFEHLVVGVYTNHCS